MKQPGIASMLIGGSVGLFGSVAYLLLGLFDPLGMPAPLWARVIFLPADAVGLWIWNHLSHSMPVCYTAGVFTMTVLGGVLGGVFDLLASSSRDR